MLRASGLLLRLLNKEDALIHGDREELAGGQLGRHGFHAPTRVGRMLSVVSRWRATTWTWLRTFAVVSSWLVGAGYLRKCTDGCRHLHGAHDCEI
jgi:hypothetical protein